MAFLMLVLPATLPGVAAQTPPHADAGADVYVDFGIPVTLSGSGSDAEDPATTLHFRWRTLNNPLGPELEHEGRTFMIQPVTDPDAMPSAFSLRVRLTVTDSDGMQATDEVVINYLERWAVFGDDGLTAVFVSHSRGIHVDPTDPSAWGPWDGTRDYPFSHLAPAILKASRMIPPGEIYVEAGTYQHRDWFWEPENPACQPCHSGTTVPVRIPPGVSMYGG